jgi:hypothetical protein
MKADEFSIIQGWWLTLCRSAVLYGWGMARTWWYTQGQAVLPFAFCAFAQGVPIYMGKATQSRFMKRERKASNKQIQER